MKFVNYIDKVSEWTGIISMWMIIPLIMVVVYGVTLRYIFNVALGWTYDTSWMIYGAQLMIGGAYTLLHNGHVKIDIVYDTLSTRRKSIFNIGLYASVVAVMIPLTWYGIKFAADAWSVGEKLSTTDWFFPSGPSKTIIPLAFFLIGLQSLSEVIRNILILKNNSGNSLRKNHAT